MSKSRLTFLVRRVGPYHDARFEAAGRHFDLTVAETRPCSDEYPWTTRPRARNYALTALPPSLPADKGLRGVRLAQEMDTLLCEVRPELLACSGWADPEYHAALRWCQPHRVPALLMSDSTYEDEVRQPLREMMKGPVVRAYAAAVVAGTRSRAYLGQLGFPAEAIFDPLDVVDNAYFEAGADLARQREPVPHGGIPGNFLCVARFIPKKNHHRLLTAYAGYVAQAGASAWNLLLSGSGPLEHELRQHAWVLGLENRVRFLGFQQYPELPSTFAQAGALILPSLSDQWGLVVNEAMAAGLPVLVSQRCGCAPELVRAGENGWSFDPLNVAALQQAMVAAAGLTSARWHEMSRCAREIIADYSPESFAEALQSAGEFACRKPARAVTPISRAMVSLLANRTA